MPRRCFSRPRGASIWFDPLYGPFRRWATAVNKRVELFNGRIDHLEKSPSLVKAIDGNEVVPADRKFQYLGRAEEDKLPTIRSRRVAVSKYTNKIFDWVDRLGESGEYSNTIQLVKRVLNLASDEDIHELVESCYPYIIGKVRFSEVKVAVKNFVHKQGLTEIPWMVTILVKICIPLLFLSAYGTGPTDVMLEEIIGAPGCPFIQGRDVIFNQAFFSNTIPISSSFLIDWKFWAPKNSLVEIMCLQSRRRVFKLCQDVMPTRFALQLRNSAQMTKSPQRCDGCSMIDPRMVFMRNFFLSALAFLMKGEHLIVKNFLVETARLQSREKMVDLFKLGQGVMPASFMVHHCNPTQKTESLLADFGETAIGRVAPVYSGLWWIILLRAYTKWTGDNSLAESPNCQRAMHLILRLCLSEGCDTSPALLCADGCSMIDRRMGIYGYPIEIQALFLMAMRCALSLLKQDSDADFVNHITKRIQALSYHLHSYYWLDFQRLNDIYRYKTEEYSQTALNKFNVIPESIPDWIFDFMTSRGGYFIGNVSPARMDFWWFCLGNFIAILSSLATGKQAEAILDLVEERWQELIGEMPLKICYPAMENQEWQIVTGCDPKNTRWSYHNGGSWPVLLWLLVAVSVKLGRPHLARRAVELMEQRLAKDDFPKYYDGKAGRYVGKQARKFQTWSMAGYLVAKMLLDDPSHLRIVALEDDGHSRSRPPFLKRSNSCP